MSDRCRARVIRVKRDKHGAVLASAAAIGDTVLLVKDAGDLAFDDEISGSLLVDDDAGTQLTYTDVEYVEDTDQGDLTSPDIVSLAAPLAVAIDADTQLWVYEDPDDPTDDDGIVSDWVAICVPEEDEDAANLGARLEADIPPDHRDDLPVGEQPTPGVPVVLEYDDDTDEWTVLRLRGARRGMRYNRHHLTAGAAPEDGTAGDAVTADEISAGVLTRQLPHRRIVRSQAFRALVNGVEYGPGAWDLDPINGVVALTLGGWETTDNADIWFEYWHRGLTVVSPDPDTVIEHVDLLPHAVYRSGVLQSGGAEIWNDASDATGTLLTGDSGGSDTPAIGWLDALEIDPATVTDIAIVARYLAETTEGLDDFPIVVGVVFDNPGGGSSSPYFDVAAVRTVHSQPVIAEDAWFLSDEDFDNIGLTRAEVADRLTRAPAADSLADGMRAVRFEFLSGSLAEPPATGTRSLTVYEAKVRVFYEVP